MPLSISSSSERVPHGTWGRTWVAATVLLIVALAAWKTVWTVRGYGVSLPNSATKWAEARTRLTPESTVLLGTSRIQVGLVPSEWAAETGGAPPLQLALPGTSAVKTLRHLATDTDFRGLAIVEIVDMYVFDAEATGSRADEAIADYRAILTNPARRSDIALARLVPGEMLMRNQELGLYGVLDAAWKRSAPRNLPANMQPDRWIEFELDRLRPEDIDYAEYESSGRPATDAERDAVIADLKRSMDAIRERGGRVVLVAFPACGERRAIEERRYPRPQYWDVLAAAVAPVTTINAYDVPELMQFQCADGSHVDETDARAMTRTLARMINQR